MDDQELLEDDPLDDELGPESADEPTQETAADRRAGRSGKRGKARGVRKERFADGAYRSLGDLWGKAQTKFGSPISPQQGIRQAFYVNRTLVRVTGSEYRLLADDERLQDLGLALCDLENLFPPARIINVVMPIPVAIGAQVSLTDDIVAECPEGSRGWRWRQAAERRRARRNAYGIQAEEAQRPYVVSESA